MADVNEIMKLVMKSAAKIAVERPDLQLDPTLPLVREKHPEWFDPDEKPRAYCDKCVNSGPEVGIDETGMCRYCRALRAPSAKR
jgi:hypothetical protein